ncbi:MAG: tRNA (adenosine(37)-N6)-threonylcarbamoyltransferase complex dimerization subunit type 1 TsaB [Candidatus Saccharibacteria bacterium]|nr:tRNA (adenosine(37)-N6)-threonylcarbamoyltransferase complex dimerization subunit type 1 TsaB [Candidatus Saccharibacteria bacterium]
MIILTIKSDQETAHVGLFDDERLLSSHDWQAGRQLAETLHSVILDQLSSAKLQLESIQGIVGFLGPGSFTGLRIGLTTVNTLAYALDIPAIGAAGPDWEVQGIRKLLAGEHVTQILPEYGAPVHITLPKK